MDNFVALLIIFIMLVLYFAPTIVALNRKHRNQAAIFLLNLLGGWTGLLWLGALVWSVSR